MATPAYWNEALETRPWAEVEQWQASQVAAMLPGLRQRSALYARLHRGLPQPTASIGFADLQKLPFTLKDDVRAAQDEASDAQPLGCNHAAPLADIVQCLSTPFPEYPHDRWSRRAMIVR